MSVWSIIFIIVAIGLFLFTVISFYTEFSLRKKMKNREKLLKKSGISPHGASLSHGMCIDKNTNKIVSDQRESSIWYKRLIY